MACDRGHDSRQVGEARVEDDGVHWVALSYVQHGGGSTHAATPQANVGHALMLVQVLNDCGEIVLLFPA